ncbi:Wadjet anti-phage system protein JetA family protein [Ferrovibrio sp. MS7]|uniref:Wadjet anti-phage system protein JetA family protein n=1 Tax=Ferrovibrio plantarum TaxID=3119164 RepID=UPI0031368434
MAFDERITKLFGTIASANGALHYAVVDHLDRAVFQFEADMPTVEIVREAIHNCLAIMNHNLVEEADDQPNLQTHYQVYRRLRDAGWIEEIRDRFRVHVNFTVAGLHTLSFVRGFSEQTRQSYGGSVKLIHDSLHDALADANPEAARANADKVMEAANLADRMARHFRVVMSTLRKIEGEIARSQSTAGAVEVFFRDFVSETLITDWATLKSTNSPFRVRAEIINYCEAAIDYSGVRTALAQGLLDKGFVKSEITDAVEIITSTLDRIRMTFEAVADLQERIDRMMVRVQTRVNSRLRYLDSIDGTEMNDIETLRRTLSDSVWDRVNFSSGIARRSKTYDQEVFRFPNISSRFVAGAAPAQRPATEEDLALQRLKERFENLGLFDPQAIGKFILSELQDRKSATLSELPVNGATDLLNLIGFYGLDRESLAALETEFGISVQRREGNEDNEWFTGSGRRIEIKDKS